jgi:hypothetical protein
LIDTGINTDLLAFCGRPDAIANKKRATAPFSAAAQALPPDTAAGGRSSNSYPTSVSRGLYPPRRTSLIERSCHKKFLAKIFGFSAAFTDLYEIFSVLESMSGYLSGKSQNHLWPDQPPIEF